MDLIQEVSHRRDEQLQFILNLPSWDHVIAELKYFHESLKDSHYTFSKWPNLSLGSSMVLLGSWTTFYYYFILAACHPAAINRDRLLVLLEQTHDPLISALPLIETLWDKFPQRVLEFLNFLASEISFLQKILGQVKGLDSYREFAQGHAAARLESHASPMQDYRELVNRVPGFGSLYSHLATRGQGDHLRVLSNLANFHTFREVLNMTSVPGMKGVVQKTAVPIHLPYLCVEHVVELCQLLSRVSSSSDGMGSENVIISFFTWSYPAIRRLN
ncbi:hypothetical protein IWW34DRAFT_838801 [Fusarium oxysporum f. sp. albedinis]|nr:hypothetical protein IWW34DRAFT_838801 [Fusarium oxysporum f. sp. albedinis]